MKLSQKQKDLFTKQEIVVFSTVDANNYPRAIFVVPSKVEDDKIIISDVKMATTKSNLDANDKVFIAAFDEEFEYLLKIKGKADYQTSGDLFDEIHEFETGRGYEPKGIIVVDLIDIVEEFEEE